MKKLIVCLMFATASCTAYQPFPKQAVYVDCEDELRDCYKQNRADREKHNKQMMKAFFGTLFVVSFMHWTR